MYTPLGHRGYENPAQPRVNLLRENILEFSVPFVTNPPPPRLVTFWVPLNVIRLFSPFSSRAVHRMWSFICSTLVLFLLFLHCRKGHAVILSLTDWRRSPGSPLDCVSLIVVKSLCLSLSVLSWQVSFRISH